MNTYNLLYSKILRLTMCVSIAVFVYSCSNEDELQPQVQDEHTVQMLFSATPPSYADSEDGSEVKATRAATADWPDGARLYLRFGNNGATGTATYEDATKQWTLTYSGTLTTDENATCEVWYFENPASADATSATLSPTTATFHTDSAIYLYHSNIVHLCASLEPTEARLRYKGTPGTVLTVAEWPHYTTFTRLSASLFDSSEDDTFTLSVGSDGYTPYIYVHSGVEQLHVEIESMPFYYLLSQTDLLIGGSYSTAMPTESLVSDGKWRHSDSRARTFTVTGNGKTVMFKMIKVEAGTFTMGATEEQGSDVYDDEEPAHQVTLTKDYYIGQTEVTQALWQAVMGSNPSNFKGDNLPVEEVSWEDCQTFITKLNSLTYSKFRLPTEAEWEYAARGGNKSRGYKYSGSNSINDVAWYTSTTNNSGTKPVATKAPNELGIYDMSGNVYEWCNDWDDSYSSSPQTNPTGASSGFGRMSRGGSWNEDAGSCRVSFRFNYAPEYWSNDLGLRLCLGAPIEQ